MIELLRENLTITGFGNFGRRDTAVIARTFHAGEAVGPATKRTNADLYPRRPRTVGNLLHDLDMIRGEIIKTLPSAIEIDAVDKTGVGVIAINRVDGFVLTSLMFADCRRDPRLNNFTDITVTGRSPDAEDVRQAALFAPEDFVDAVRRATGANDVGMPVVPNEIAVQHWLVNTTGKPDGYETLSPTF